MADPTHPALTARLRSLARNGFTPAEARRRVLPLARRLGLEQPSYSTVLRIVSRERIRHERLRRAPGVLESIAIGRVPTPVQVEGTLARALEHKAKS